MELIKTKAENLSKNLNKVATALARQCEKAEVLEVNADDIMSYAEDKMPLLPEDIDTQMMMDDFAYVRGVLKENTECARRMLEHVSSNMLDEDDNITPGMLTAFSELNKSIAENMKLYIHSYKDLSAALTNLRSKGNVTNNLNIINTDDKPISVKDIINKLRESQ